jgi:hypothetical protein
MYVEQLTQQVRALASTVVLDSESRGTHEHIVSCRAVVMQWPPDRWIYEGRFWEMAQ